jgi:hypothetical protein
MAHGQSGRLRSPFPGHNRTAPVKLLNMVGNITGKVFGGLGDTHRNDLPINSC